MPQDKITQARLKERLRFDQSSASFIWLPCKDAGEKFNEQWPGRPAGSIDKDGWFSITIDGRRYPAVNLLWLYTTGKWPPERAPRKERQSNRELGKEPAN